MPTIISILAVIFLAENIIIHDFDRKSKQHEKSLRLVGGSFFFKSKRIFLFPVFLFQVLLEVNCSARKSLTRLMNVSSYHETKQEK